MDALAVEVISSFAHRRRDDIHLVLHLPGLGPVPSSTVPVRFSDGRRRLRVPAEARAAEPGTTLELSVPAKVLGHGVWRLAVRPDSAGRFAPVEARLLTSRRQPIALIPGPAPATRLPEPTPRSTRASTRESTRRALVSTVLTRVRRRLRSVR